MSVASVLMFIVPFTGVARMVWIAIAYNLFYAVAYPIYNTANSTLIPVSTRNSQQRSALASFTNVAGLGVMGVGSMIFPMLVSFALKEDQHRWFLAMLAVAVFTACLLYTSRIHGHHYCVWWLPANHPEFRACPQNDFPRV